MPVAAEEWAAGADAGTHHGAGNVSPAPATDDVPVFEVDDAETAKAVVAALLAMPVDTVHACDTEVADIDISKSPIGQGRVTCVSVYSGPLADYGRGPGQALWVDTTDPAVMEAFRPFLEAEACLKAWHNYGFDRHVLFNHGIDVRGFAGDTMHMARLWDASRNTGGGYSLEALTDELLGRRKVPMKELFGVPVLKKDGTPGKKVELPPVDELQTNPLTRSEWIGYSVYDAQGTWLLYENLRRRLEGMDWQAGQTLFRYYKQYWRPFGELLTDMEREGIRVEKETKLPAAERRAKQERDRLELVFRRWAASKCPEAWFMNPSSGTQVATLLFGGSQNVRTREYSPTKKEFQLLRDEYEELLAARDGSVPLEVDVGFTLQYGTTERNAGERADGAVSGDVLLHGGGEGSHGEHGQQQPLPAAALGGKVKVGLKHVKFELSSLNLLPPKGMTTKTGAIKTDAACLRAMAGAPFDDPPTYGQAYEQFGGGAEGARACEAIASLLGVGAIDTMLSNFILPLQENADEQSRVHCSLNLNTETGRLSSRAPNLQNQPALEKDQYRIREAFTAKPGNALVVADYGQLELRLLAHMTDCQSMIDAFRSGGCFHSRTAMGMFDHVRASVESGECLLEWDYSKGDPPAPLLKDIFGSERRRAKTLNFSIAYGKTVHGLSKDWGVSVAEARAMLDAWYEDRPEVQRWQRETIETAHRNCWTRTLMGRYRSLSEINGNNRAVSAHLERAAINTPIQGGAADVMTLAMIKISRSETLKKLGYKLLLQIHDEVILEGPEEFALEAKAEVVACMERPFDEALPPMKVDLLVDAKTAGNWYEAK
jgi:DNA polymerase-1